MSCLLKRAELHVHAARSCHALRILVDGSPTWQRCVLLFQQQTPRHSGDPADAPVRLYAGRGRSVVSRVCSCEPVLRRISSDAADAAREGVRHLLFFGSCFWTTTRYVVLILQLTLWSLRLLSPDDECHAHFVYQGARQANKLSVIGSCAYRESLSVHKCHMLLLATSRISCPAVTCLRVSQRLAISNHAISWIDYQSSLLLLVAWLGASASC